MHASVHWDHGLSFNGSADSGFEVALGADPSAGGENDGFRPMELMAISLIGCTAMDVISILQKKRQQVERFAVEARIERADDHPHVFTQVEIRYRIAGKDIEEAAVQRAIELSKTRYCPAQAMLGQVVPIELKYEIEAT